MTNRLLGWFFAVFGLLLFFVLIPRQTEVVDYGWMRPQTLPDAMAIVIAVSGLVLALRPRGTVTFEWRKAAKAALYLGLVCAGVYLISLFGFEAVAPPLALLLMILMGERRALWLVLGVAGIPFMIWLAVPVLLGRPLP
ncbi:MAG: tripartite tricarboxylate transporter TctB family protein [Arenicellales bacterium]